MRNSILSIVLLVASFVGAGTADAAVVQWNSGSGANNHYYEFVPSNASWSGARTDALSRSHLGLSGYLATVTSAEEDAFLTSLSNLFAHIGGSDMNTEGTWIWVDGPEASQVFWNGGPSGSAPSGAYANWGSGEPSDFGEDFLIINWLGHWNDGTDSSASGYFVEYSGAISEPVTLALLGVGLLGLGMARRRTRRGVVSG